MNYEGVPEWMSCRDMTPTEFSKLYGFLSSNLFDNPVYVPMSDHPVRFVSPFTEEGFVHYALESQNKEHEECFFTLDMVACHRGFNVMWIDGMDRESKRSSYPYWELYTPVAVFASFLSNTIDEHVLSAQFFKDHGINCTSDIEVRNDNGDIVNVCLSLRIQPY